MKIRHNETYETQYLHMSRKVVKQGQTVRQGEVIGYVGQTGLATGPHVCFRFGNTASRWTTCGKNFPPLNPFEASANKPSQTKSTGWNC